jgi:hypothetical protein
MTLDAAANAGLDLHGLERRELALKGKKAPTSVAVIGLAAARPNRPDARG